MTARGECMPSRRGAKLKFSAYQKPHFRHIILVSAITGGVFMCRISLCRALGIATVSFGVGVLVAFLLPGYLIAFVEAAAVVVAGTLLLKKYK